MADGITTPEVVDAMLAFAANGEPKRSKLQLAEAYLTDHPAAKNDEVKAAVGCSNGTVWFARQNLGIPCIRRPRRRGPTHGGTKLERVAAYLRSHPDAATKDVKRALQTDDATVGRARKLVHRVPGPVGSDHARIAQHLRVMLEHSLKCFDADCADCLRAEGLLESEELGETSALARMMESAVVVQERATQLVDTLQAMRPGPERDRELSLQGVAFRKLLNAAPSFADLPHELQAAARARLEPRARP
jgi:hypothetical protein